MTARLPSERVVVTGLLLIAALVGVAALAVGSPFDWDEAVYATRARSLVTDVPAPIWGPYRPPGLALLGVLAAPSAFADVALRGMVAALGLVAIAAIWLSARRTWGRPAAIIALVAAMAAPVVMGELVTFHNDLPSLALVLSLMLVLWHQFEERREPDRWLLVAGVLAPATFYLRYGSLVALVAIGLTAVLLWPGSIRRHRRLVGATVLIAAIAVVPHVLQSIELTGSPTGIVLAAVRIADTVGPLDSLEAYLNALPRTIAGPVDTVLLAAGVLGGLAAMYVSFRSREWTPAARRYGWLLVPAVLTLAGHVAVSHAEPRYLLVPLALGIVAGAGAMTRFLAGISGVADGQLSGRPSRLALGTLVLVALAFAGNGAYTGVRTVWYAAGVAQRNGWQADTGRAIGADSRGPCLVVTSLPPIIGWYSGCEARQMTARIDPALGSPGPMPTYLLFTALDPRRVRPATLERHRAIVTGPPWFTVPPAVTSPEAEVFRLGP